MPTSRSGQSLIDVLIASGVGAILLVGALSVLAPALRGSSDAQYAQDGASYARGLQDGVRALAASDWNALATLTPGSSYYLDQGATSTTVVSGVENRSGATSTGPTGLVGYWTFNENSGTTAADISGSGLTGTLSGGPSWVSSESCRVSRCIQFDGVNDLVTIPNGYSSLLSTQATISVWVKLATSTPSDQFKSGLMNFGSGGVSHYPWLDGYSYLNTLRSDRVNGINDLSFDRTQWHLLTITTTPGSNGYKVYRNTTLIAQDTGNSSVGTVTSAAFGGQGGYMFQGYLDEARLYNRALSLSEITEIYNGLSTASSTDFSRSFAVYPVQRNGAGVVVTSGGSVDPSTLKVVVTYEWPRGAARTLTTYVSRSGSKGFTQSDWSGGGGLTGTTTHPGNQYATSTGIEVASTTGSLSIDFATASSTSGGGTGPNISATSSLHYAWNDIIGWINFYSNSDVEVKASRIEGSADTAAGEISLDCATSPAGNICGTSNYYVTNNGGGALGGYAWNDTFGWISFSCANHGGCGASSYGVSINSSTGDFSGYAWNDLIGWISFNCADIGICGTSNYRVNTSWRSSAASGYLDSAIIDTGIVNGAQVNGLSWIGSKPSGTDVRFQIATASSSSGPWNYYGSDGTGSSYYNPASVGNSPLYPWLHPPGRYFRYRVTVVSDSAQTLTPRVDDVIVRWSP